MECVGRLIQIAKNTNHEVQIFKLFSRSQFWLFKKPIINLISFEKKKTFQLVLKMVVPILKMLNLLGMRRFKMVKN